MSEFGEDQPTGTQQQQLPARRVPEFVTQLGVFLGGIIVSLALAHFTMGQRLSNIEGKLSEILVYQDKVRDHDRELGAYNERLNSIETRLSEIGPQWIPERNRPH